MAKVSILRTVFLAWALAHASLFLAAIPAFAEDFHEKIFSSDLHERLGLDHTATPAQIKERFRKLVMKHHPDHGGSSDTFRSLREAHDLLLDSAKGTIGIKQAPPRRPGLPAWVVGDEAIFQRRYHDAHAESLRRQASELIESLGYIPNFFNLRIAEFMVDRRIPLTAEFMARLQKTPSIAHYEVLFRMVTCQSCGPLLAPNLLDQLFEINDSRKLAVLRKLALANSLRPKHLALLIGLTRPRDLELLKAVTEGLAASNPDFLEAIPQIETHVQERIFRAVLTASNGKRTPTVANIMTLDNEYQAELFEKLGRNGFRLEELLRDEWLSGIQNIKNRTQLDSALKELLEKGASPKAVFPRTSRVYSCFRLFHDFLTGRPK